jgi:hypothetical protein
MENEHAEESLSNKPQGKEALKRKEKTKRQEQTKPYEDNETTLPSGTANPVR